MIGSTALGLLTWAVAHATAAKVIIDNVSPMITYTPPLYGERAESDDRWDPNTGLNAWNTTFPQVTNYRPWDLRKPTDPHYTYVKVQGINNYPTAEISFVGTGIVLIGPDPNPGATLGSGFAKLKLDDREQDCRSTGDATLLQCAIRDLKFGRHLLTVTVQQGGFAIGRFEIDTGKEEAAAPTAIVELSDDNKRVTNGGEYDVAADGQWDGENQSTNYDKSLVVKWNRAVSQYNGTSLSAKIPKGVGRVEVWGAVDVDHSDFAVEIDPPAYGLTRFNGNAFNLYTVQNISMYETMLDPGKAHTIKVTNMHDAYLDISQFKLYEAHGGGSSGLSAGAIAGIVVGAVAALALAGLLVWCCLRRRKRQTTETNHVDMESDPGDMVHVHDVEPYHDSPRSPPMSMAYRSSHGSVPGLPHGYAPSATSAGLAGMGAYHTQPGYPIPTPPSASHQSSGSTPEPLLGGMAPGTPGSPGTAGPFTPLAVQNPEYDEGYMAASTSTVGIAALDAKVQPRPVTYHHVQHTDNEVVVTEAPPVYNPEWAGGSNANSGAPSAPSGGAPSQAQSAYSGERQAYSGGYPAHSVQSVQSDPSEGRNSRIEKGPSLPMSPV